MELSRGSCPRSQWPPAWTALKGSGSAPDRMFSVAIPDYLFLRPNKLPQGAALARALGSWIVCWAFWRVPCRQRRDCLCWEPSSLPGRRVRAVCLPMRSIRSCCFPIVNAGAKLFGMKSAMGGLEVILRTNGQRFRGREMSLEACRCDPGGLPGGSHTWGDGVDAADTWPAQVSALAKESVLVTNGRINGDNALQRVFWYER
jgi:hypothetical protein